MRMLYSTPLTQEIKAHFLTGIMAVALNIEVVLKLRMVSLMPSHRKLRVGWLAYVLSPNIMRSPD
jgi:hypothetical protein